MMSWIPFYNKKTMPLPHLPQCLTICLQIVEKINLMHAEPMVVIRRMHVGPTQYVHTSYIVC
jgi:hypothetical protein